jgi:cytochrome c oxidase subunit 1
MLVSSEIFSSAKNHWLPVRSWSFLAILTLALSGLAPMVLIAGRASIYADMAMVKKWFTPMLVVHVNLSVGLWFLAMTMVLMMALSGIKREWRMIHQAASISFLLGILAIACGPLAGGEAFTSNYIPVQNNALFFMGLGAIFASLLLMVVSSFFLSAGRGRLEVPMQLTMLTLCSVLACFIFSVAQHPKGYGGEAFYEMIFWGGGHVLQIVFVQLGMIAWILLADTLQIPQPSLRFIKGLFAFLWLNSVAAMGVYWLVDINDGLHLKLFTWQMIAVVGTVPAFLALWYLYHIKHMQWREHKPVAGCFVFSLTLFFVGGVIAMLIQGSNTIIPAHYHGSTVGITLALMGVMFVILPKIGGKEVTLWKTAIAQPWLYGMGQVFHVIGLAVAGGHDIQRKTAGSLDVADQAAAAALQVMRLGGLLAVIGGGLFVVVAIRSLWRSKLSH